MVKNTLDRLDGGKQLFAWPALLRRCVRYITSIFDFFVVWSGMLPLFLLEGAYGWQISRIIEVSCNLGIIDSLSTGEKSDAEIAEELKLDFKGTRILLQCLHALGHIERQSENRYKLSGNLTQWGHPQEASKIRQMLIATSNLRPRWEALEETIRSGGPLLNTYQYFNSRHKNYYEWQMGMALLAGTIAPFIAAKTKLKGRPTNLLDLGGSHAVYSTAFQYHYPDLQITIIDTVEGIPVGISITNARSSNNHINFVIGDIWQLPLGSTYDLILIFNILHANDDTTNIKLLNSARQNLSNDGRIIILDQFVGDGYSHLSDLIASLTAMNLFNEMGGQAYTEEQLKALCASSSLLIVQKFSVATAPGCIVFVLERYVSTNVRQGIAEIR